MGLLADAEEFSSDQDEYRQVTVEIGTGTSTLQSLLVEADGTKQWVEVPNSNSAASTSYTIHCPRNQVFRFLLTGDAQVSVSG